MGVSKADKQAIDVTVPRDVRQETSREPHQLAETAAGCGIEDMEMPTMKHNDLQLRELLDLARNCLKYDRLPGQLSERKFFDKFDAEHHAQQKSNEMYDSVEQSLDAGPSAAPVENAKPADSFELSPPLEGPGEDPPDARTLRKQTLQLERTIAEARQALEAAGVELGKEVLKRQKIEKDEQAAEVDYEKSQKQLRLAKDMVKRQNGEIKKLHGDIQDLKAAAVEAARPILHPPVVAAQAKAEPQPPAGAKGTRPRPGGRPLNQPGDTAGVVVDPAATKQPPPPPFRHPRLAESIVLPPKEHTYERVLLSRPKDDAWKKFIP